MNELIITDWFIDLLLYTKCFARHRLFFFLIWSNRFPVSIKPNYEFVQLRVVANHGACNGVMKSSSNRMTAGFPGKHYCPRMATMNKPTFQAIKQYSPDKPVLVFVSSRRQTRLTALDLISFLVTFFFTFFLMFGVPGFFLPNLMLFSRVSFIFTCFLKSITALDKRNESIIE